MTPELFNPASYVLNLHAVPTLLTAIAVISLGLIVLLSERQSRVSASFFAMTGTAAIWLSSYSLMYCAVSEPAAAAWAVIGQFGVTFIPASVYYFTVGTLQIYPEHKIRVWLICLVSAAFYMTVIWSDVFLSGVYHYWWGYYPKYQWMSVPFLGFFFGMMALSLRHYWREFHGAMPGTAKQRSNALFIAFCVVYLGSFDYFAAFGIPLYPFGYLPVLGFIILTARAVWRYRLVDITPAFAAKEIINAMADALLVLDNEGIVRVANSAACRLFARTEQRLLGSRIQELAAELASPGLGLHRRILSGSLRDFEFPLPPAERGGTSAVSVSVSAMRDQEMNPVTFVCIIRDITQREKARGEIQRHTERQTALYEVSLATASTLELRVVLNVLLEKVTSLVPQTATTIMLLSDDKRELIKVASRGIDEDAWKADAEAPGSANSHPVLESKDAIVVSNLQIHNEGLRSDYFRKNGFISYLGVPLIAQDQVLGILSFYCPQQRYFSDEEINFLRTLAGKAAAAIHNSQLYEQTRQQTIDLEKANRVKDEFLSVMSHELRTPLNVIAGYTKIVQDGMLGEINPEQFKALDKVTRHSEELLLLVNSIMDAAKIEAGGVVIETDDFPLAGFLDDLKPLYDYPLGKDVVLQWDYPSDLPVIRTDRDKLKHIAQNLINNALKFTDVGFVRVSARQVSGSDRVELSVADSGIGIAAEELPSVFERFRQADSSRTRTHGGIGLGLHIVKTFTEILGGTVGATSQLRKGSTFTVTIPCVLDSVSAVRTNLRRQTAAEPKA